MFGAFAPLGWWWLAPVAVGLHVWSVASAGALRACLLGALFSVAFLLPRMVWVAEVSTLGWLAVVVALAPLLAAQSVLVARVATLRAGAVWVASTWVLQEAVLSRWPFGGLPWNRLVFSQVDSPSLAVARLAGASAVTFVVALAGVVLYSTVHPAARRATPVRSQIMTAAGLVTVLGAAWLAAPVPAATGSASVAVVQGGVPSQDLDSLSDRRQVLANHVDATIALGRGVEDGKLPAPDVVVWPESATVEDPRSSPATAGLIRQAMEATNAPILFGAVLDGSRPGRYRNSAMLWEPGGEPEVVYDKQRPVPFGEYMPGRRLIAPLAGVLQRVPRDMQPGAASGVASVAGLDLGVVICFEVAFTTLIGDVAAAGAEALVVQSNNAMFGDSWESQQQLDMARVAAVEHGRDVVVSSTSGLSAVIDASGTVRWQSDLFTTDSTVAPISQRDALTLGTRWGPRIELALVMLALVGLGRAMVAGRKPVSQRADPPAECPR